MRKSGDHGRRLSGAERVRILQAVAAGQTFAAVAAAIGCSTKSIQRLLVRTGGVPPRDRPRSPLRLSLAEREEISRGLERGDSRRAIARRLGRAPSTIAREVAPNGGAPGYRAWQAARRAAAQARRPKTGKLARSARLRAAVARYLAARWSPQQIAERLRRDHPADPEMRVSHQTMYRSLFVQGRGALRRELSACLRTGRTRRHPQGRAARHGRLLDMVPLSARPPAAADRAVPGHWEGDLLFGQASRSAIGTLVERHSRYVLLFRLPDGRTAAHVRRALAARMSTLPAQLRRTLTWDQGKEMAEHVRFRIETGIPVYFCDPRSPWQRPSNENTNGLLRQYFPHGTALTASQAELNAVARELNGRPRRVLEWQKPCEVFARSVAMTG